METLQTSKKANIIIDASQFDLFDLCECRYNYRYNMRRSLPVIHKNTSLDKGSLAHEGLQVYYELLKKGEPFKHRIEAMTTKIRTLSSDPTQSNIEVPEVEHLIKCVTESQELYQWEDEMFEILAIEQPFAYVLFEDDDVRIIMSGKIDLLVNKPAFAGSAAYFNLPIDHKTYQRDSPLLRLSNQFQNYCAATESDYLVVNRIGLQAKVEPNVKHKRIPLSYDHIKIEEWKNNIRDIMLNNYLTCVATNKWPQRYTSCNKFNRLCEYFDVCDSSGEESKKFKLESNYVEADPWDVTKKMEDQ